MKEIKGGQDMLEFIRSRRSTRAFAESPVDQDLTEMVLEAGRYAPSGGNSQTSHFLVIRDRQILDKLALLVREAFADMEITEGMYPSMANSIRLSKGGKYVFHYNAPVLILAANRKDYGNNLADISCALENMMLMANALDLGSCWINQLKWLNEEPEIVEYLYELGMKENERVYGAVIIGVPASGTGLPNRGLMTVRGNEVTWID
jgi:nitroreductase